MKKYLIICLFQLSFDSSFSQCLDSIQCGLFNTVFAGPQMTNEWFNQTFVVPHSGYLEYLKIYAGVTGNTASTMEIIFSNNSTEIFIDTLPLPAAGTNFSFCNINNWSTIYPNIFLTQGENYSFQVRKLDETNSWLIYAVNSDIFLEGSCTNNLNEIEDMPDPSDLDLQDQMTPENDCAFILGTTCSCLGDYNFDGTRSILDLVMLINAFGETSAAIDISGDDLQLVSVDDLVVFIGLYGVPCP